jgi:hypothetical protein
MLPLAVRSLARTESYLTHSFCTNQLFYSRLPPLPHRDHITQNAYQPQQKGINASIACQASNYIVLGPVGPTSTIEPYRGHQSTVVSLVLPQTADLRYATMTKRLIIIILMHYYLLATSSVVALSGSPSPIQVSEELGCSPTLIALNQNQPVFFDPLGLATDDNFPRLREAELKHGRVAMFAVVGLYVPPLQTMGVKALITKGILLDDLQRLSFNQYLGIFVVCGILETVVFVQRNPQDMPGDYGTGYWGVRNKGLHERSLLVELENGRLAMLAMLLLLVVDLSEPETWQGFLRYLLQL